MFEAGDTFDNINKVLHTFSGTIKNMQHPEFCLKSHKLKIVLNGDFKYLSLSLCYQGLGGTYPTNMNKKDGLHLDEYEGLPHILRTCEVEVRKILEFNK